MNRRVSVAELLQSGLSIQTAEAVAIIAQLVHTSRPSAVRPARLRFGPPTPATVFLELTGTVTCEGCETTPAVSELAVLLQRLLPPGTPGVPGALRYTMARALLDVDAPPFDSVDQFWAAVARHERGDRQAVVRGLLERAPASVRAQLTGERRRAPQLTELRRELRATDVRLYDQSLAIDTLTAMTAARPSASWRLPVMASLAAGLIFVGAAGARRAEPVDTRPAAREVVAAPAPTVAPMVAVAATEAPPSRLDAKTPDTASAARPQAQRATKIDRPTARQPRRAPQSGLLNRLHLGWLRSKLIVRADNL